MEIIRVNGLSRQFDTPSQQPGERDKAYRERCARVRADFILSIQKQESGTHVLEVTRENAAGIAAFVRQDAHGRADDLPDYRNNGRHRRPRRSNR